MEMESWMKRIQIFAKNKKSLISGLYLIETLLKYHKKACFLSL